MLQIDYFAMNESETSDTESQYSVEALELSCITQKTPERNHQSQSNEDDQSDEDGAEFERSQIPDSSKRDCTVSQSR